MENVEKKDSKKKDTKKKFWLGVGVGATVTAVAVVCTKRYGVDGGSDIFKKDMKTVGGFFKKPFKKNGNIETTNVNVLAEEAPVMEAQPQQQPQYGERNNNTSWSNNPRRGFFNVKH